MSQVRRPHADIGRIKKKSTLRRRTSSLSTLPDCKKLPRQSSLSSLATFDASFRSQQGVSHASAVELCGSPPRWNSRDCQGFNAKRTLQMSMCLDAVTAELERNQSRTKELIGAFRPKHNESVTSSGSSFSASRKLRAGGVDPCRAFLEKMTKVFREKPCIKYLAPLAAEARRRAAAAMDTNEGVGGLLQQQRLWEEDFNDSDSITDAEADAEVQFIDMGPDWEVSLERNESAPVIEGQDQPERRRKSEVLIHAEIEKDAHELVNLQNEWCVAVTDCNDDHEQPMSLQNELEEDVNLSFNDAETALLRLVSMGARSSSRGSGRSASRAGSRRTPSANRGVSSRSASRSRGEGHGDLHGESDMDARPVSAGSGRFTRDINVPVTTNASRNPTNSDFLFGRRPSTSSKRLSLSISDTVGLRPCSKGHDGRKKSLKGMCGRLVDCEASPTSADTPAARRARTARLKACNAIFNRLQDYGEVPCEGLGEAVCMLGHPEYRQEWITDIVDTKYNGRSNLDREEFIEFLDTYEARDEVLMRELFYDSDIDGSGTLDPDEIAGLLRRLGVSPISSVVQELMLEATEGNALVRVSFNIFVNIYNTIKERFGFTATEAAELNRTFLRFDRDNDGLIDRSELFQSLAWMGYSTTFFNVVVKSFCRCVKKDRAMHFDLTNFFQLVRMYREREVLEAHNMFIERTNAAAGRMPLDVLPALFEELGYVAVRAKLIEELISKHLGVKVEKVKFEEMYLLLNEFRKAGYLLAAERADIFEVFHEMCDDSSRLGGIRLKAAVRWLGYMQGVEEIQDALVETDLGETNTVTYPEFILMLRSFTESEITTIHEQFRHAASNGICSADDAARIMLGLGLVLNPEQRATLTRSPLDINTFVELFMIFRAAARDALRQNYGFTALEMKRIRHIFTTNDVDDSGNLVRGELGLMMEQIFPDIRSDPATHARAKELLIKSSQADGSMSFKDFMVMMRYILDEEDEKKIDYELATANALGLARREVVESRKLFRIFDQDHSGDLDIDELKAAFALLLPLGKKAEQELIAALNDVDHNGDRLLDFPEFLRLMHKLQGENWAGINGLMQPAHPGGTDDEWSHYLSDQGSSAT